MKVYKIRNKKTGLFIGSKYSWKKGWSDSGRIYTRLNHATCSLRSGMQNVDINDCEIVEYELCEVKVKSLC